MTTRLKRASYREAIECIALNDEPCIMEPEEMCGMATVLLVAAIFGTEQERVARDVIRLRRKVADTE